MTGGQFCITATSGGQQRGRRRATNWVASNELTAGHYCSCSGGRLDWGLLRLLLPFVARRLLLLLLLAAAAAINLTAARASGRPVRMK